MPKRHLLAVGCAVAAATVAMLLWASVRESDPKPGSQSVTLMDHRQQGMTSATSREELAASTLTSRTVYSPTSATLEPEIDGKAASDLEMSDHAQSADHLVQELTTIVSSFTTETPALSQLEDFFRSLALVGKVDEQSVFAVEGYSSASGQVRFSGSELMATFSVNDDKFKVSLEMPSQPAIQGRDSFLSRQIEFTFRANGNDISGSSYLVQHHLDTNQTEVPRPGIEDVVGWAVVSDNKGRHGTPLSARRSEDGKTLFIGHATSINSFESTQSCPDAVFRSWESLLGLYVPKE